VSGRLAGLAARCLLTAALLASCSPAPSRYDGEMVRLSAGEVWVGDLAGNGRADERPARRLRIACELEVGRFEVTNAQYARFVAATGHAAPAHWRGGECPAALRELAVTHVSWHDAQTYCRWAGVRLLTEAEWEYAARGATQRQYPFGDVFADELANTRSAAGAIQEPVGSRPQGASPAGIEDLAGGVWEWVQDAYDAERWARLGDGDAAVACEDGMGRVLKGGAWTLPPELARTSARDRTSEHAKGPMIGFRVAREVCDRR
jgi:iron(II)-dependent oxidoreductase